MEEYKEGNREEYRDGNIEEYRQGNMEQYKEGIWKNIETMWYLTNEGLNGCMIYMELSL